MIACIMAGNSEKYLEMCIKAIEPQVDKVIICYDTSSKDKTYEIIMGAKSLYKKKIEVMEREYEHDEKIKNANSNQRNFYLEYLKEHYSGEWVLCLDADEVVDRDVVLMEKAFNELESKKIFLLSPRMEHFIGDLGHVDATREKHFVQHRMFKISEDLFYPNGEHPVLLTRKEGTMSGNTELFTIWHMASVPNLSYFKERYKNHLAKSEIHTSQFLQSWYYSHIFGFYPTKKVELKDIPRAIKDEYIVDDDYFYFAGRDMELKQVIDAAHWRDFFKPRTVLLVGDGKAIRTTACRIAGLNAYGFDISKYAVENNIAGLPEDDFWQDDVLKFKSPREYDLVVAYDLLEHIYELDMGDALKNLYDATGKYCLISVPMIGDPNLNADPTHKIFWTREQWEDAIIKAGFKLYPVPKQFQFREQLIIGEKNDRIN